MNLKKKFEKSFENLKTRIFFVTPLPIKANQFTLSLIPLKPPVRSSRDA
jgi:hypothetical protein